MHACQGDRVRVIYQRLSQAGPEYPAGTTEEIVEFIVGSNQVITGIEEAVLGMLEGEEKMVTIPKEKAYGSRMDDNVVSVKRHRLPAGVSLEVGKYLCVKTPNGRRAVLAVSHVGESDVMLNANHPLAGRDLTFRIRLTRIERPARRMQGIRERRSG